MSKASVAARMGISPHTVDMYIRRARLKYAQADREAPTKADMLLRAIEDGLLDAEAIVVAGLAGTVAEPCRRPSDRPIDGPESCP